ncbi:hypothetical protein LUZ60_004595 [Juncus effusus]|nr:hypothetical protein LUZ60_004595 [Juncus effusus]
MNLLHACCSRKCMWPCILPKGKETITNPEMTSNGDPDRLSNLPDAVLITILSLLKARDGVQTCVLSKRWRNLWAFVPFLDFNCDDFVAGRNVTEFRNLSDILSFSDVERFQNFVSTYLRLRDNSTDVHSFSLRHTKYGCNSEIWGLNRMWAGLDRMWIRYALKHNVKKLALYGHDCIDLPDTLFTSESLEVLSMDLIYANNCELIFSIHFPSTDIFEMCSSFSLGRNTISGFWVPCP